MVIYRSSLILLITISILYSGITKETTGDINRSNKELKYDPVKYLKYDKATHL